LREVKLAIPGGMTVILFLLTSRISREGIPRICSHISQSACEEVQPEQRVGRTASGISRMAL
jgi:hypothetical protein